VRRRRGKRRGRRGPALAASRGGEGWGPDVGMEEASDD
jgi:hypothetical protein